MNYLKKSSKSTTNQNKFKKILAGNKFSSFYILASIVGLALSIYISYRASISDRKLFSISLIALIAGLLFESIRVSRSWKTVAKIFSGTYLFSFMCFLPGKHESRYNFDNHIETWPYYFIIIFALFFGIIYKDKVTAKLTEGITLLLSISLIYWAIDYGFLNFHNWFSISMLTIGSLFSIYSIVNALTTFQLSNPNRLMLSVWSTIVMFAFAVDNIIRVFSNPDIENAYLSDRFNIGIQYFLLGVSAVYILQNYLLLAGFLPSKNGNYKRDLKENIKDHLDRFSDQQVNIGQSLFCIFYAGTAYWLNHTFQILPRHTMIWLVISTFPLILHVKTLLIGPKTES